MSHMTAIEERNVRILINKHKIYYAFPAKVKQYAETNIHKIKRNLERWSI